MKICETIAEMRVATSALRGGKRVGFVPTMGALHEGHASLLRAAKMSCEVVAASIFVNPAQFGAGEDLEKYPRCLKQDCDLMRGEGVDLVFAPSVEEMYPAGALTWVEVEGLSGRLDGRSRPGHFRGVTTVVAKLFHVVEPEMAFFGQKDAAQLAVVRRMVRDLDFGVEIVACPIVRETDGLAMSSRNIYLDSVQRRQALVLHRALLRVRKLWEEGERDVARLVAGGQDEIAMEKAVRLDYFEIVDAGTLEAVTDVDAGALVAVAAWVGGTRLVDNIFLGPDHRYAKP